MLSRCFHSVDEDILVESAVKNFEKNYKINLTVECLKPYLITQIVVKKRCAAASRTGSSDDYDGPASSDNTASVSK